MIFSNGLELSMETSLYNLNLGSAHTDRSTQGTVILIRLRVSTLKDNYIGEVKQCMRKRTTTTITSKKKTNIFFKNTKNPPPKKKINPHINAHTSGSPFSYLLDPLPSLLSV